MGKITQEQRYSLEKRLNYSFNNISNLTQALSHRSAGKTNNERLEFLGDSLLGFVVSHMLYSKFPNQDEGILTRMRSSLIKKDSLAKIANRLELAEYIILSHAEARAGGCYRSSTLADAFEAIIAAIYFDGGFVCAEKFVKDIYVDLVANIDPDENLKDPKSRLQELLQQYALDLPVYELVDTTGPAHAQTFTVSCKIVAEGKEFVSRAGSRREGEQKTAAQALKYMKKKLSET